MKDNNFQITKDDLMGLLLKFMGTCVTSSSVEEKSNTIRETDALIIQHSFKALPI